MFTPGSLKWIVIDETHTFSGAGAAELAMLLRRVLTAFSVKPSDVRFATSSATIGNAQTEDEKKANDEKLRHFISDISGVDISQIKLITGDRIPSAISEDKEKERCRKLLSNNDYVKLSDLFPDGSIADKLKKLDEMCEGEDAPLKAKLHLFYRVPNNGLRVRLDKFSDGVFDLFSSIPADSDEIPYLELLRCSHCGEYFAAAESVPNHADQYRALTSSSSDLFDFNSTDQSNDKLLFSKLSINRIKEDLISNNISIDIVLDEIEKVEDYDEVSRLNNIVKKRINSNHKYSNYILKNKIINEMISLGYIYDDIIIALDSLMNTNDEYNKLIKEYNKLYFKYSKKYSEYELERIIKNKLYTKGFKYDDIKKEDLI